MHKRSAHHMRGFPQVWREDRGIMERVCEHGVGHPDPDEYRVLTGKDDGVHGCCGCCRPPAVLCLACFAPAPCPSGVCEHPEKEKP